MNIKDCWVYTVFDSRLVLSGLHVTQLPKTRSKVLVIYCLFRSVWSDQFWYSIWYLWFHKKYPNIIIIIIIISKLKTLEAIFPKTGLGFSVCFNILSLSAPTCYGFFNIFFHHFLWWLLCLNSYSKIDNISTLAEYFLLCRKIWYTNIPN